MDPKLKKCKHCNQEFMQRMQMQTYCTFECNNKAKQLRDSKKPIKELKQKQPKPISQTYGRDIQYPRLCRKSRDRKGFAEYHPCEKCGLRSGVDRHHIRGRVGDLLNDVTKIIRVCRECHGYIHTINNSKSMKKDLENIVSKILKK